MAFAIPFPVPSKGFALNSKLRVNLDAVVTALNALESASTTPLSSLIVQLSHGVAYVVNGEDYANPDFPDGPTIAITSTDTSYDAGLFISVLTAGLDPLIRFTVENGAGVGFDNNYSLGVDNSDSDKLKISRGAPGSTDIWISTGTGEITQPLQPAFLVRNSSEQSNGTGDDTNVTITFDTEISDQGGDFNSGTYTFTAPVTGCYNLTAGAQMRVDSTHEWLELRIVTSNRNYHVLNTVEFANLDTESSTLAVASVDMDANDTAYVQVSVGTGNKTADVIASTSGDLYTWFSGDLAN